MVHKSGGKVVHLVCSYMLEDEKVRGKRNEDKRDVLAGLDVEVFGNTPESHA